MRRSVLALVWSLALAGAAAADLPDSPDPATLAVPPAAAEKAARLVEQLGSKDFERREAAYETLRAMGRLARPALLAGVTKNPSAEVRARCADLLPKATELDLKARIDTFLADTEGRYEHDLPGWDAFRAVACGRWSLCGYTLWTEPSLEQPARRVFATLFPAPANRTLLSAVDGHRGSLAGAAADRRVELYYAKYPRDRSLERRDPTLEDMTALLFAEGRVPGRIPPVRTSLTTLIRTSGFTDAARADDDTGKVYRAVAAGWIESASDPREMYSALTLASSLDLPGPACRVAARLLGTPGTSVSYRGRAAAVLVESGGREHIPLLDRATADEAVVYTLRFSATTDGQSESMAYEIQARDIALAAGLLLSGQKPADYGFSDRYPDRAADEYTGYLYTRYYFADEATRKKAFTKWAGWRAANP